MIYLMRFDLIICNSVCFPKRNFKTPHSLSPFDLCFKFSPPRVVRHWSHANVGSEVL